MHWLRYWLKGNSVARKLQVDDWVLTPSGACVQLGFIATGYTYVADSRGVSYLPGEVRKLPASPAVLAKSHRLLMFWCEHGPTNWWDAAMGRHWKKIRPQRKEVNHARN